MPFKGFANYNSHNCEVFKFYQPELANYIKMYNLRGANKPKNLKQYAPTNKDADEDLKDFA